ncbi:OmpG family monomeric porin [Trabulsiella odontotermitis]|uniref:OmpG family monomeric porin n=1 Tax=Trabulsiella odontotermitis TaxID=379893 RepID=UPI00067658FA|nr:OmpG family monomeric porin [Trabulsiella odontotermitis]KNC87906.1 membrane protein [Trabulsiella odontotermitis]
MSTLQRSAALLLCAGVTFVHAAEQDHPWDFNVGAMIESENVEGQGEDQDGLFEPSVYFNASKDAWRISVAMYQEGPVNYSDRSRGTYFDRPELEIRYQFTGSDDFTFGLTGGFRNYSYHFEDESGKNTGSANMQRYKLQPDWDIKLSDDWRFSGWLALYQFGHDLDKTGYADSRVETESGVSWRLNETVSVKVNYYLERGFNTDNGSNNGEFSTQEIRAYLPISLGQTTITPYTRLGLDRWSNWDWQDDPEREGHHFNRLGLLYAYDFDNGFSTTLEYAHEWEDHDEGKTDKFHYIGVGINYAF